VTNEIHETPAPPKADPETLVLRGAPGRVVRFRRGAVIALAALGSTAIVGTAWVALKPATFRMVAGSDDRGDSSAKAPADALAGAPKSYGDVPQLGTPLPGDLGRPILDHQRSLGGTIPPAGADQAAQAAEAERERIAAEAKAARESGVMMQVSGASRPCIVR
jgi:type IV secretory pathway VirB10-like protein